MQIGMIGLGRMGANMATRLLRGGHDGVVHDPSPEAVARLAALGATGAASLEQLASLLARPRALWLMVPAAAVDGLLARLTPLLQAGDIVIDGGNSYYHDDLRRAADLDALGIHHVDVGTSGGIAGLERGYCLMVGLARGAYVLADAADGHPDVLLLASGSEVALCIAAYEQLQGEGVQARVVSMPSWDLFERQDEAYRERVLPETVRARVSVEAAAALGWERYVGRHGAILAMRSFGLSAPGPVAQTHFGFDAAHVVAAARQQLARHARRR